MHLDLLSIPQSGGKMLCPTRGGSEFKPTHTTAQHEFLALRPILRGATTGSHVISSSGHSLHPAPIPHTAKPMASGVDDLATTALTVALSALHQLQEEQIRTARTRAALYVALGVNDDATDWSEDDVMTRLA